MFNLNINMPTVRVLLTPVVVMLITISLGYYSFSYLYPNIRKELSEINGTQSDVKFLTDKVDVLKQFSTDAVSDKSDVTYIALPDTDPAAVVISQVRRVLAENGIATIKDISFTGGANNLKDINGVEIDFEFEAGDVGSVSKSLLEIQKFAPLVSVQEMQVLVSGGKTLSEIKILAQWSDLPKALPDITSPITNLSAEERTTFDKILTLRFPNFSQIEPAPANIDRTNPFN